MRKGSEAPILETGGKELAGTACLKILRARLGAMVASTADLATKPSLSQRVALVPEGAIRDKYAILTSDERWAFGGAKQHGQPA